MIKFILSFMLPIAVAVVLIALIAAIVALSPLLFTYFAWFHKKNQASFISLPKEPIVKPPVYFE